MKNLKSIMFVCFALIPALVFGQAQRGTYGTYAPYFTTQMKTVTPAGVAKSTLKDTLTNGDTGFLYVFVGAGFAASYQLDIATLTGTVASSSLILYGYNNGGAPLSAASAASIGATPTNAYAITGNTTYCAGCVGASSTTVPGAAKRYTWEVPNNAGALFDNYIIRVIQTGTATATYQGKVSTQY